MMFVAVKIFLTDVSKEAMRNAVAESLSKLKLTSIDLLLLSVPSNKLSDFDEAWSELQALATTPAVQNIGVSDFDLEEFEVLFSASQVKRLCEFCSVFQSLQLFVISVIF